MEANNVNSDLVQYCSQYSLPLKNVISMTKVVTCGLGVGEGGGGVVVSGVFIYLLVSQIIEAKLKLGACW